MATLARILIAAPRRVAVARRELSTLLSAAEEFPGLPETTPEQSKASTAAVSTLSNGLTVVTEDSSSTTTVAITFPGAGSANETAAEAGAALANKCLAFKSGSGLSSTLIYRNMEDDGAIPFASADRTGATVGFTAAPEKAIRLVPLLATECSFEKWDVRDAKSLAQVAVEEATSNAQVVLTESLYAAAFGAQSALGMPFFTAGASTEAIESFRVRSYVMSGAVLAATGVDDHAAFVSAVEERLAEAVVGSKAETGSSPFMGGESRVHVPNAGFAHVAIGFTAPDSSPMANVLKHCLALGGTEAFGVPGLVGVYGGGSSAEAMETVDSMCATLTTAPSADVVKRAKALAKAEALFGLEDGSKSLAAAMTTSVLETGTFNVTGVAAAYDAITTGDAKSAFSTMIKNSPALAAVGDISSVPYHATIAARFS